MAEKILHKVPYKYGEDLEVVCTAVMKNICCPNKPVLVVRNGGRCADEGGYYARCACGKVETIVSPTIPEALHEWEMLQDEQPKFAEDAAEFHCLCCIPEISPPALRNHLKYLAGSLPKAEDSMADFAERPVR